ncbi:MAG TPA: pilus assembly protein TadG-related protein [Noviherbaspirillum sp.]|nr:pilus assembly protein TadG-related protein [Noviherbaspirillum sp.]
MRQQGQALIYGIFIMLGGLAALFFLFNTGQLSEEKTKLVTTADAVAYSAGVMHARALNFDAYNNRALVANEVLVAQMVSLSSWAQYAQTHAENLPHIFPECADPYGFGAATGAAINYGPLYAAMCYLTVQYAGEYISGIASEVPKVTEAVVTAVEASKAAIKIAETLVHSPLFTNARRSLMQDVANANYLNDGLVTVEPVGLLTAPSTLKDDWPSFTKRYAGEERGRFAEVAELAAYRDRFVEKRSWNATALIPPLTEPFCAARGRKNEVRRRGGTELINYDEWKAEDTESFWRVSDRRRFGIPVGCRQGETPIAWGEQQAHPSDDDQDDSEATLGGSPSTNPQAHGRASSEDWTGYTGLPSFYDLSSNILKQDDPRLRFTVRVARPTGQTKTSGERSQIPQSPNLNTYQSNFASGEMVALASSEVYFERPAAEKDNLFGKVTGKPRELGSLFNPYWQVRLVQPTAAELQNQQTRQGAVIPD